MLRLVLALIVALVATVVAGVGWLIVSAPVPLGRIVPASYLPLVIDTLPFALAVLILVGAICLFRRSKSWPSVLLIAGAVALLIVGLHDFAIGLSFHLHLLPAGYSFLFPTGTENPLIALPVGFLRFVSLSVFVGLFCYVFQATRRHLTRRWS
jgi:hypothetical protein